MLQKSNDEGVSAVIGVILIVAITVVLAATIAVFGFTFNDDLQKHYTVGTKVDRTSNTLIVVKTIAGDTYMLKSGGTDHHVQTEATYSCTVNGVQVFPVTDAGVTIPDSTGNFDASAVGNYMYFTANQFDDVTIIAHFTDGTQTALYSGRVD